MRPTLAEMTTWTPLEIEAAIRMNLPPGVRFECGFDRDSGAWFVRFLKIEDEALAFEDWGFEQRLTYFNGYGWVWAQHQTKPPAHSPWRQRQHEVAPNTRVSRTKTPDPGDVDPKEIQAVYDRFREQTKKR